MQYRIPTQPIHRYGRSHKQSGAAVLVLLVVVIMGSAFLLVNKLNKGQGVRINLQQDIEILSQARDALIGAAVLASNRPGEVPCPDLVNTGISPVNCTTAASRLGHFPWQTLGTGDLRDSSGERLWYAVAASHISIPGGPAQLNSNTAGTLTVDGISTLDVVAVIFTPGRILNGQNRANPNNVNGYLECDNTNAGNSNYITAPPTPPGGCTDFNDRLTVITRSDLMKAVEPRVLGEVRNALINFYNTAGINFYPYAAELVDPAYNCANTLARGRLPLASGNPPTLGICTGPLTDLSTFLPAWFAGNNWQEHVYYSVAPACEPGTSNCTGPGGLLTVNNVPNAGNKEAVVISAGPAFTGQNRAPLPGITEADLMEDPENTNANNTYTRLAVSSTSNDQIRVVTP